MLLLETGFKLSYVLIDKLLSKKTSVPPSTALADLDFDLGVATSYVGLLGDDYGQTIAAVVYGGVDVIGAGIEFAYIDEQNAEDAVIALSALVNINAIEDLPVSVYFAIGDFSEVKDTIIAGASVEYELNGVGLGVKAEFVSGTKGVSCRII